MISFYNLIRLLFYTDQQSDLLRIMHNLRPISFCWQIASIVLLACLTSQQTITWSSLPCVRSGQINSIITLTSSSEVATEITDQTGYFFNNITNATVSDLQYGLSLSSYESWMTDTFSFNITLVELTTYNITVRFLVLDNTYFTKAKVHYIVIWRNSTFSYNFPFSPLPGVSPTTPIPSTSNYVNIEVLYGCYLTHSLRIGGNLTVQIGNLTSSIMGKNYSALEMKTMIAGMQLSNNLGFNNYVDVQTFLNASKYLKYIVSIQQNSTLTQICLTTVIYDPYINSYAMKYIVQSKTMILNTTNNGLADVPYQVWFDGEDRMFFGFSRFNLSMSNTRYLNVQTSNFSMISMLYDKNQAMNEVIINMLFLASRTCSAGSYYQPISHTCVNLGSCPKNSVTTVGVCKPCHYSCWTCTVAQLNTTNCDLCNTTTHQRIKSGTKCSCTINYADIGNTKCVPCNQTMLGCLNCTSKSICTVCKNPTYVLNTMTNLCQCNNSYFAVTGYCLKDPGCVLAQMFNDKLVCVNCDITLNFIRDNNNVSCICNLGYLRNISSDPVRCYDKCNDSIAAVGKCDDGNLIPGDGCDEVCNVERGFHCTTAYNASGYPGKSTCVTITSVKVTYLYAQRILHKNSFKMAFSLRPIQANLTTVSFNSSNFVTNILVQNQIVSYEPSTGTVFLQAEYLQSIEGNLHSVTVSFLNNPFFYSQDTVAKFTTIDINAQLVLQEQCSYNSILQYIALSEGALAILLAIFASVVGLKMAGIELLIPIQTIYFTLATLQSRPSFVSTLNNLKYANGFGEILSYEYFRTYNQHLKLVGIQFQAEFILNTNIMIGVFLLALVWILVHHFIIKYKQHKLQVFLKKAAILQQLNPRKQIKMNHSDSSDDKQNAEHDQQKRRLRHGSQNFSPLQQQNQLRQDHHYSHKIFSFQMDRFYFIFYIILVNQIFFGFNVMGLNYPNSNFQYPEQVSIILCNLTLLFLLGNLVFIYKDQKSNKMINFNCINDRYAYLYLTLNAAIIILISFTFQSNISIYVITAISVFYILLVIIEKPYSQILLQFQNLAAIYLDCMLLTCLALLCVIQSIPLSEQTSLIISCLIFGLILLGEILTVIRIRVKINFKKAFDDLKSPFADKKDEYKTKKKVIEKDLDFLANETTGLIPPDSVRHGLFTPKDKMIDWEMRNTEQYHTLHKKESLTGEKNQQGPENESQHQDDHFQKDGKINELQVLKRKLRNNLRQKRETESKKTD